MSDAEAAYRGMSESQRRRLLLVEYHCADSARCPLLRVWHSLSLGPSFYQPAYVLTEARNLERSNEEGRARHTTDGGGRWTPTFGRWAEVADEDEAAGWELHCRHTDVKVRAADVRADIDAATPGRPVRRRIARVSSSDFRTVPLDSVTQDQ